MKLWTKIFLAFVAVIAVALLTLSLLIGWYAGDAYRGFMRGYQRQQLTQLAAGAEQIYSTSGSWDDVQAWLNASATTAMMPGMGMNTENTGRGNGRGQRRQGMITTPAGVIAVDAAGHPLSANVDQAPAADSMTVPVLVDGQPVAALAVDAQLWEMDSAAVDLLAQVNRAILWSALTAGLVALLAGAFLLMSILRPLRRLKAGVSAVAAGDLSARVVDPGSDELGRLARDFNSMAAALEEQEALRQRLVADIAHELRTPLSVVQGNLQAILDGVYPLNREEVTTVYEETQLLSRLVNDLHELAQAEAGRLPLHLQPLDAAETVTRIVVDFQSLAAQRGVTLMGEPPAHTLMVAADPDRLQQILNNLVGNALRHTPADGRVEIGAASHNDDGEAVRFSILNTGETIPGADLPYVFERFYRSDTSRSRDETGRETATSNAGLGLSIVKALVESQHGRVGVQSASGRTEFWFTLPCAE